MQPPAIIFIAGGFCGEGMKMQRAIRSRTFGKHHKRHMWQAAALVLGDGILPSDNRRQRSAARIAPCDSGAYEYVLRVYLPLVLRN